MDLSSIEQKIKDLVERCQNLKHENATLKKRCQVLSQAHDQAMKHTNKVLKQLKSLHKERA